jgi:hypothetical protein
MRHAATLPPAGPTQDGVGVKSPDPTYSVLLRPQTPFNGVKVFTASQHFPRNGLGERITEWLASHPRAVPLEFVVRQSSDSAFHCVTVILFYREE